MTAAEASSPAVKAAASGAAAGGEAIDRSNACSSDDSIAAARSAGARLGAATALERSHAAAELERILKGERNEVKWGKKRGEKRRIALSSFFD